MPELASICLQCSSLEICQVLWNDVAMHRLQVKDPIISRTMLFIRHTLQFAQESLWSCTINCFLDDKFCAIAVWHPLVLFSYAKLKLSTYLGTFKMLKHMWIKSVNQR